MVKLGQQIVQDNSIILNILKPTTFIGSRFFYANIIHKYINNHKVVLRF